MNFSALLIIFILIFNIISSPTHVSIDHHEEHNLHCELCINTGLSLSQINTVFSIKILKKIELGLMINASEIINKNEDYLNTKKIFNIN